MNLKLGLSALLSLALTLVWGAPLQAVGAPTLTGEVLVNPPKAKKIHPLKASLWENTTETSKRHEAQLFTVVAILPKNRHESAANFVSRLKTQVRTRIQISGRGRYETQGDFLVRIDAQTHTRITIPRRSRNESSLEFQDRIQAQLISSAVIHPRAYGESHEAFSARINPKRILADGLVHY